ncbi:MAG: Hsp33 family molecular chaperone HslO [Proteobacteria bacterium]|nr:Hsp33 family molecular chaperone HslO [Pseudomonadota bacterium]MCP4917879.1 Hsp33 family molecular chaperone HslO [Pseudomonadota bacterium]
MSEGRLIRGLVADGRARVLAVVCPDICEEVRQAHGLGGQAARHCAEGLLSTLLLSAHIKGDERLMIQVQAEKPRFAFHGEARADGSVRARLTPGVYPPASELRGAMLAIKWEGDKELYRGAAELDGSFERSLQHFLVQSQQAHGVVRLGVTMDGDRVTSACGLLVEMLGGQWDLDGFEPWVAPLRTADLGATMTQFAFAQLLGGPVEVLEARQVTVLRTTMARVEGMLRALGPAELRAIAAEEGQATITCQFTNEDFVVPGERLEAIAGELEGA